MLRFAEKVLKHYGPTDDAYRAFLTEAWKCEPPLEEDELQTIWENTKKFYREEILTQSNGQTTEISAVYRKQRE